MKQLARKSGLLSIVRSPSPALTESSSQEPAGVLRESFDGWLSSLAPTLLESKPSKDDPKRGYRNRRPLTFTDIIRVNRATIREGDAHRPWPPDVVLSFLTAEVIKRNS